MRQLPANQINRIVICQAFLDALGQGIYLEVGVNTGHSFKPIVARSKWGVDPAFTLSWRRVLKYRVFAALRLKEERLFRMTSDSFFEMHQRMLKRHGVDVAFLDGLHTYEQTLRDVMNTLKYLRPGGVILIHDCNPLSELAATPAESINALIKEVPPHWNGVWNGDVWKTIVHLRSLHPELDAVVLDCDQGVGVVRRKSANKRAGYSTEQILEMGYPDLEANREDLLGLVPPSHLWKMIEESYNH